MLQSCCQPEGDVDDFVRSTVLPTVLISLKRTVLLSSSYNLQLSFLQKGKSATAMLLVLMKQVLITRQIATIRRAAQCFKPGLNIREAEAHQEMAHLNSKQKKPAGETVLHTQ